MQSEQALSDLKGLKIAVLAGGISSEREISLLSGRAVHEALVNFGIHAEFIDICDIETFLALEGKGFHSVFLALHGAFGEDGSAQELLEGWSIPYTGSGPLASALAMDKVRSKEAFRGAGVPTPRTFSVLGSTEYRVNDEWFPCVVKPALGGSSMGISVVSSEELLNQAVEEAQKYGEAVLVEPFIAGRELTVGILEENPLPAIEILTPDGLYDVAAKYSSDQTKYVVPAELPTHIAESASRSALDAHHCLGCRGFSRVDMRLSSNGELFVLEVNTIPGLTERSLLPKAASATGLDFTQLCVKMLRDSLKYNGNRKNVRA